MARLGDRRLVVVDLSRQLLDVLEERVPEIGKLPRSEAVLGGPFVSSFISPRGASWFALVAQSSQLVAGQRPAIGSYGVAPSPTKPPAKGTALARAIVVQELGAVPVVEVAFPRAS